MFAVGVLIGGKEAALGVGAEVGAEVNVEDDITIAGVKFKLIVELKYIFRTYRKDAYIIKDLIKSCVEAVGKEGLIKKI